MQEDLFKNDNLLQYALDTSVNKKYSVEKTLKKAELNYGIFSAALLAVAGILIEYISFSAFIISVITVLLYIVSLKVFYQLKERTHEN